MKSCLLFDSASLRHKRQESSALGEQLELIEDY